MRDEERGRNAGARRRVLCVVGTRPEAIKMAPVIAALSRTPESFEVSLLVTGQHRDLLDQVLRVFDLRPDRDLDLMTEGQSPTHVTAAVLRAMEGHLAAHAPEVVLAQGDTTTVMATAMACFYAGVSFGHVEAGLRTGDLKAPYPEEYNRRLAGITAEYHFAPTPRAAENLLREGVEAKKVFVTGNTVIDALLHIRDHTKAPAQPVSGAGPYVLMTCHRREVFGEPIREIFAAVRDFAAGHREMTVWYPVHPNPNVKGPAEEILGDIPNVILSEPLDYVSFVHAMSGAALIISDSGGVQEEAPSLGKPVLVLRDVTERPEAVEAGTCLLVGPHRDRILAALDRLLDDHREYERMSKRRNPFGDGRAAERIAAVLSGGVFTPWEHHPS